MIRPSSGRTTTTSQHGAGRLQEDHKVDQGTSVSIEFDTPGTYHYVCTLHENDMDGGGERPVSGLRRDVVILACAVSAGIHGALAPAHFADGTGAGLGFVASTVLLAALAVALTVRPASTLPLAGAAIVFTGLVVAYALATTTGLPLLHPHPEPVDGLALATKAFEVVGLATGLHLLRHRAAVALTPRTEGHLT